MKFVLKFVRCLAILMFFPFELHASDRDSVLLRAEQHYHQSEYSRAIAEYYSLIESGWVSAALLYNMGNAYFKNHDLKSAILYYERAKRLAPKDEAINANLEHSRNLIFDRMEALPEHFLVIWGKAIRDLMTVRAWSWLAVGSFISVLALGLLFLFVNGVGVRKFAFLLGICCLSISIFALSLGYLQKANIGRTDEAIVFVPSITVKSSPTDGGVNLFTIHEGTKVRIEDKIGEWCEIRISDGNKGWIRFSELMVI